MCHLSRSKKLISTHQCYCNRPGSSRKQTLFLKDFNNPRRCIASIHTFGWLGIKYIRSSVYHNIVTGPVHHHMDKTSPRWNVPTMLSSAIEIEWKHYITRSLTIVLNMGYLQPWMKWITQSWDKECHQDAQYMYYRRYSSPLLCISGTPDTAVSIQPQVHLVLLDYCHRMDQVNIILFVGHISPY